MQIPGPQSQPCESDALALSLGIHVLTSQVMLMHTKGRLHFLCLFGKDCGRDLDYLEK